MSTKVIWRASWTGVVIVAALVITLVVHLLTREQSRVTGVAIQLVTQGQDWVTTGASGCGPANAATPLTGSKVEFFGVDGRARGGFDIGSFQPSDRHCAAYADHVEVRGSDERYLVRVGQLPLVSMTRQQLVTATSPDAYAGLVILVTNCRTACDATVRAAVELPPPGTTPSP